ncbi:MAG: hypothetical protein HKN91_11800 [Acidimicrobiia bacterium]|nr:hypothetical protein [Acidimicrobiia bacterium]
MATGRVTTIDGVPIAPPGQSEGIWFSHGNAVSVTAPEAGGPVLVNLAAVIATDQGQFQTYTIGHDSRGAYPPPDFRSPENYAAFDASLNTLAGSVGVAIEAIEAGEVATTTPAVFTSSGIEATYTGSAIGGTVAHPDLDIVFIADTIERRDLPVFSSPECYQAAVESAGE